MNSKWESHWERRLYTLPECFIGFWFMLYLTISTHVLDWYATSAVLFISSSHILNALSTWLPKSRWLTKNWSKAGFSKLWKVPVNDQPRFDIISRSRLATFTGLLIISSLSIIENLRPTALLTAVERMILSGSFRCIQLTNWTPDNHSEIIFFRYLW